MEELLFFYNNFQFPLFKCNQFPYYCALSMADITAATAIGWLVSPIIRSVIDKTQALISNDIFSRAGVEGEMKKMEITLTEILSIMGAVEKQGIENQNQVKLMWQIKDAVYDAEDVMDEFEYNILQKKSENKLNMVSRVASFPRAICQFVLGNEKFRKKVKVVMERLDRAKISAETLLKLVNMTGSKNVHSLEHENWCVTSSMITDDIIGRENECKLVIDLLFKQADVSPTIIPIVGQGGLGKTTLAQMVFNDSRIKDHFDQTIWLSVSDNFDKVKLTKDMLKCLCDNCNTVDVSFEILQRKLEKELAFKKILLVFDDVWYDKDDNEQYSYRKEWSQVLAPLKEAESGSKILLTTRLPLVGHILGSVSSVVLDGLSDDDSWSLFELCAFDGENQHDRLKLEPIGKEIVKKLKGSALAIKVVGAQLRGKVDIKKWSNFLYDNPLDTSDIMNILHRSYQHLPEHLQRCFAYCSLFPKYYIFSPIRLVQMWITHGFVHPQESKSLEEVGRDYFNGLVARSFIHVVRRASKEHYVMHDLMVDLARHVSRGECYMLNNGDSINNLGSVRHLSIANLEAICDLRCMHGFQNLRTLLFLNGVWLTDNRLEEVVSRLKRIRVLEIEWSLPNLPNIGECKHLRYLSFIRTADMDLPTEIFSKLHHLRVLCVRDRNPHGREGLPSHVTLPKIISSTSSLLSVDTGSSLIWDRGRYVFAANAWRGVARYVHVKKKGNELVLLGDMDIKGYLHIEGLENVTVEEATRAMLGRKEHVTMLTLEWSNLSSDIMKVTKSYQVIEALRPNSNVERLFIWRYPGVACPSWLESNLLFRLQEITLYECNGLHVLPALGQLVLLRRLRFHSMSTLRKIGPEFFGSGTFPSLEELTFIQLNNLEKWSFPCHGNTFPKLHKLEILNCPKFVGFEMHDFAVLKELRISNFRAMITKSRLHREGSFLALIKLELTNCGDNVNLEGMRELVSLEKFWISDCPKLSSLPGMEFFYSLKLLAIFDCQELRSLPKKGLPVSLQAVCINGAHPELEDQIRDKRGRDWDKVANISGCRCITLDQQVNYERLKRKARKYFNNSESFSKEDFLCDLGLASTDSARKVF